MLSKTKQVLYFGSYSSFGIDYARNRIIRKGLKRHNVKVIECSFGGGVYKRYLSLTKCFLLNKNSFQTIIVGFPGHYDLLLAFVLGKLFKKRVIFDIFASLYETYVLDRAVVGPKSIKAYFYKYLDWLNLKLADLVLVDTRAHGDLYKSQYGLNLDKTLVCYVGSDNGLFYPKNSPQDIDVLFYGSYQPLQGIDKIILAAKLLPQVKFVLIGRGQTRADAERQVKDLKLKNIKFVDWVKIDQLANYLNRAKIILGIFGSSAKAKSVIPNKVYDGLACQKAVITAENNASREILKNEQNCVIVKATDTKMLANKIEKLLSDSDYRMRLAKNGFKLYQQSLTPEKVVSEILKHV